MYFWNPLFIRTQCTSVHATCGVSLRRNVRNEVTIGTASCAENTVSDGLVDSEVIRRVKNELHLNGSLFRTFPLFSVIFGCSEIFPGRRPW